MSLHRFVRAATVVALLVLATAAAAQGRSTGLDAYDVVLPDAHALTLLAQQGFDVSEGRSGSHIEVIGTANQAAGLRRRGVTATLKRDAHGRSAAQRMSAMQLPDGSWNVFRPYFDHTYVGRDAASNPRQTLYEELSTFADAHAFIVKREIIGTSIQGKPILALRITKNARESWNPDGSKPSALYISTQHAREWIVPEMTRRLVHLLVDNYGRTGDALDVNGAAIAGVSAQELTNLVNTRELWFVPVANPDGYDFTFTPGNRLWRKNLHDNNGDGVITVGDGVDPNRNFPSHWGYDNEGSSIEPASETYRGTGPASEPETKAMIGLFNRVGPAFLVNYHSAAELLLYGNGWQALTRSEDDPIYRALAGTDEQPAIPGRSPGAPHPYHPEVASLLYTTNGDTDDTAHGQHGILAFTPEMDVSDPARGGGTSVFEFQDSESDVQDAFVKNIPFALDVARSAPHPDQPVSHLGNTAPSFETHPFTTSWGTPQAVEANVKRALGAVTVHWRVRGGPEQTAPAAEWGGGEVYGGQLAEYYHRVRAAIGGVRPGDAVKVWFEAGGERSSAFTYTVRSASGAPVLVMAAEDYSGKPNGAAPTQEDPAYADRTKPFALAYYTKALDGLGVRYDVYDVDAQGRSAPDPLGVLSHYRAVIWYTANDILIREPAAPGGTGTSRLAWDEIANVRDYLNEGGRLLYTGQNAATAQLAGYQFNPQGEPPYCKASPASPGTVTNCVPLSDSFLKYWLGTYVHLDVASSKAEAAALPLALVDPFGTLPLALNGGDSADNQVHTYSMLTTSSLLKPEQFPQFASSRAVRFDGKEAFEPYTGSYYAVAQSNDAGYQRLRKTIDLTGKTAAHVRFKLSYNTENAYDFVAVEAHTVGQDDWTTLPDANGHTSTDVGASCDINWDTLHPFLAHYQTNINKSTAPGDEDCTPNGTTGSWNAATGNSGGWQDWNIDLGAYRGKKVEISVAYIQDFATSGLGVFLDDVAVEKDGVTTESTSFESDFGGFVAGPPPPGSEKTTLRAWERTTSVGFVTGPGVATKRTLYWGFGLEGVRSFAQRVELLRGALRHLGVDSQVPGGPAAGPGATGGSAGRPGSGAGGRGRVGRLVLVRRSLRVNRRTHRASVRLKCPATTARRCRGMLRLQRGARDVGGRSFVVAPDRFVSVPVLVTPRSYRRLRRAHRLTVLVTVLSRGSDGTLRRVSARMPLVLARR